MTKLSKSIYVLLIFDIFIFGFAALFAGTLFKIEPSLIILEAALMVVFGIYMLFLKGYYRLRKFDFFLKDAYLIFEGVLIAAVIPSAIILLTKFDRTVLYFILTNLGVLYLLLLLWRSGVYEHRRRFKQPKNILIIGAGNAGREISEEILKRSEYKFNIVGFVDNDENKLNTKVNGISVIGRTSDLRGIIDKNNIKLVIVAITGTIEHQALIDISECVPQGVDIFKMPEFYEKIAQKIPVGHITADWFIYDFTRVERPLYDFLKRLFDIGAALVILTVTFPVLVFIAITVKLQDGGPVMYYQDRVGKNGKIFKLFKLRTMCENADQAGMVDRGNTCDDRIIPFCKWVRKARFDEIPQMINILKGEMSIVGPRAEFVNFVKEYEKQIPFYSRRHWITPGWTGWAQINQGHCVNIQEATEKQRYDFFYIKNRNIFWDFSILLKAVGLALSGRHG